MANRNRSTNGTNGRCRHIKIAGETVYELNIDRYVQVLATPSARTMHLYRISLSWLFSDGYKRTKAGGEIDTLGSTIVEKLDVLLEFERCTVGYIF